MASFNKVILIGNLIRDPDVKQSRSGTSFCTVTLAVNRTWYNKTDKKKEEETAFIDVGFFGKQAELVGEYLSKGSSLMVEGYLKLDQWEDKNSGEKKSKLKVQAENMQFMGGKPGGSGHGGQRSGNGERREQYAPAGGDAFDDVPY